MKSFNVYFLLLFILIFQTGNSQEIKETKTTQIEFKPYFNVGFIYPIEFGNTALATAHNANLALTFSLGLVSYGNFSAGLGSDAISYSVEKKDIIGDFETSKHNSYYVFINYDYKFSKKFTLTPSIGYGSSELAIKKNGKRRGEQDGKEFRIGSYINYNFNEHHAICLNINYINNKYIINTNEELADFFSKSNAIQIGITYRFN